MPKRIRRKARLETILNAVVTPVFLLDARRKIVFFNTGCERLTGWQADEVLNRTCDYMSEADHTAVEAVTGSFCPPPEVFSGEPASVPAFVVHRDGQEQSRVLHFFPLTSEAGRVENVLGVVALLEAQTKSAIATPAQQLHAELAALRTLLRRRFAAGTLVCQSEAMLRVLEQVKLAGASNVGVLLRGEEGAGKEHVARVIHYESEQRGRSFVPLDCRRLPDWEMKRTLKRLIESVAESEPGGEMAVPSLQPGTVYFSNVDYLSRDLQQIVVEIFQPAESPQPLDLRLLASSTAGLRAALESETIRSDFYFLVTALEIELPPLRHRPEDLAPLAQTLLESLNRNDEKQTGGFSEPVWEKLREYNWPGNIDELSAVVEEARSACGGPLIQLGDLPFRFRTGLDGQRVGPVAKAEVTPLEPLLARVETEQILLALEQARHNRSKAASLLGITRARLYRRMQALGIAEDGKLG
jgi:PAS domain S-box-containing protein